MPAAEGISITMITRMKSKPALSRRWLGIMAILLAPLGLVAQQPLGRMNPDPRTQLLQKPLPPTISGTLTFAAVGDLLGPGRPVTPLQDPDFASVIHILRSADVAFGNNEGSIFDLRTFKGYPAAQNGGGNPLADAAVARDLKVMGFDIVSKANNHATDWGQEGLDETNRVLDEAGILHVGSGRNRPEARAAVYFETPHGRIAMVATASTFNPASVAGLAQGETPGRPGISVLRTNRINLVTAEEMAALRAMAASRGTRVAPDAKQLNLFGQTYRLADKPGLTYEMNPYDQYEIIKAIRGAKQTSDLAIFTIHAHETASGRADDPAPADFLRSLYHNAIDAGADIVVAHGQHVLRGIELYKGRPIFYGLASFFFHLELDRAPPLRETFESMNLDPEPLTYLEYLKTRFNPPREWFESVIAVTEFEGDHLKEMRLYPLDLDPARKSPKRYIGIPTLASPQVAKIILERIRSMSAQFGTEIRIENNIGIITPPNSQ